MKNRRSIRLKEYDYTQAGAYFVTVCAYDGIHLFGDMQNGTIKLNECGKIIQQCWNEIPGHFAHVQLDEFVVMPNHIHGIMVIVDGGRGNAHIVNHGDVGIGRGNAHNVNHGDVGIGRGNACVAPTGNNVMGKMPNRPVVGSVGVIVGSFKSAVSKRVNQIRQTPGAPVWQRNYYEHIIRDDGALDRIRKYIANNPLKLEFEKNQTEIAKDIEKIRGMIR